MTMPMTRGPLALTLILGWSAAGATTEPALSLRLEPAEAGLWGRNASQQFVLLARFPDGIERDVTSQARFSLTGSHVARLVGAGRVVGIADGKTTLAAAIGGKTATATIHTAESSRETPVSFARDVVGILTKQGCNSSACHGSVKGRGGFKLSLDGLNAKDDYEWIVKGGTYQVLSPEPLGERRQRVDMKDPDRSLLLLKPTMTVPHAGGRRLELGSADYQTIVKWIRDGASYSEGDTPAAGMDASPKEAALDSNGNYQMLVTARFADGRRQDITGKVRYESLNSEIVKVSPAGLVTAAGPSEAAVIVRWPGFAAVSRFGVIRKPVVEYPAVLQNNFIDRFVFDKLRRLQIVPSELSRDDEFLRRICLDLTGTLPPPERVLEFTSSRDPQKREKLIDLLLESPEYADLWTFRFADLFRVRGEYSWLGVFWEWVRKSVAENKPYDQMARENIAAQGYDGPSRVVMYGTNKPYAVEQIVNEKVRVFFGRRIDCSQCHNHPFDRWTQNQYWGLAAFFGRMTNTGWAYDNAIFDDPNGHEEDYVETKPEITYRKVIHPRTKQLVAPAFIDGRPLPEAARTDLRMELAKWMTSYPYFAEAAVNRMWAYFFGRGIVDPVDDFRLTNPATHPELLEALARDFREHGYDLKHLFRTIARSRTYQLASATNETNRADRVNYSHAYPRPVEAEVLLDAISQVTGVPEVFGKLPIGTRAINLKVPASYSSTFLSIYGTPMRDVVPERSGQPNLSQALHMLAGTTHNQKVSKAGGNLDRMLKSDRPDREIVRDFYLAALTRLPSEQELAGLEQAISARASRREAFEDFVWSLIGSREFAENH
jgi:hypothetical protein